MPDAFFNIVAGWALDVGSRLDRGQVSYVELLLDGQIIANTRARLRPARPGPDQLLRHQPARRGAQLLGLRQRGQRRLELLVRARAGDRTIRPAHRDPDVPTEHRHERPSTKLVGFTTPGKHTLAIRVGDEEETVDPVRRDVGRRPLRPVDGDQPAFGYIDTPSNYQFINGIFEVFGWAFDFQGVQTVEVDVDGHLLGNANYGLSRPDVPANDPRVPFTNVGFSYFLDTTQLSDSAHDLVIYVIDTRATGRDRPPQVRGQQRATHTRREYAGEHPEKPLPRREAGQFFSVASASLRICAFGAPACGSAGGPRPLA